MHYKHQTLIKCRILSGNLGQSTPPSPLVAPTSAAVNTPGRYPDVSLPKQVRPMHTFTSRSKTSPYQISATTVNNTSYKLPNDSGTVFRSFAPAMIRTTEGLVHSPPFLKPGHFPKIFFFFKLKFYEFNYFSQ